MDMTVLHNDLNELVHWNDNIYDFLNTFVGLGLFKKVVPCMDMTVLHNDLNELVHWNDNIYDFLNTFVGLGLFK